MELSSSTARGAKDMPRPRASGPAVALLQLEKLRPQDPHITTHARRQIDDANEDYAAAKQAKHNRQPRLLPISHKAGNTASPNDDHPEKLQAASNSALERSRRGRLASRVVHGGVLYECQMSARVDSSDAGVSALVALTAASST